MTRLRFATCRASGASLAAMPRRSGRRAARQGCFWIPLLAAGLLALALRPLLVTGGEAPIHSAEIKIQPLSEFKSVVKPRPRGRTLQQILENPLGDQSKNQR